MENSYRQKQNIGVVTITDDVCFGKPRIKGTAVSTRRIYRVYQQRGPQGTLEEFPYLDIDDIKAAVKYEMRQAS